MIRPGYAVEYDSSFPSSCLSLEALDLPVSFSRTDQAPPATRRRRRRDCARESTPALGAGEEPFVLERSEAYAAVMIDDLTKKGLDEPYRLFTSRAEYRLLLGVDTAPHRAPHGRALGLLDETEYATAMRSEDRIRNAEASLRARVVTPSRESLERLDRELGVQIGEPTSIYKLLQRRDLEADAVFSALAPEIPRQRLREEISALLSRIRYDGYIRRELERIERLKPFESRPIPPGFAYGSIPGLSHEVVEKCARRRPRTLGEASRIPGVTPAAVAIISAHVARGTGTASPGAIPGAPGR